MLLRVTLRVALAAALRMIKLVIHELSIRPIANDRLLDGMRALNISRPLLGGPECRSESLSGE